MGACRSLGLSWMEGLTRPLWKLGSRLTCISSSQYTTQVGHGSLGSDYTTLSYFTVAGHCNFLYLQAPVLNSEARDNTLLQVHCPSTSTVVCITHLGWVEAVGEQVV